MGATPACRVAQLAGVNLAGTKTSYSPTRINPVWMGDPARSRAVWAAGPDSILTADCLHS